MRLMRMPRIESGSTVLFIGDSITDAVRNREDAGSLGCGYAFMAAGLFGALYPELQVQFLNRGIAGNTVGEMALRWEEDCMALAPDWISVMIGINDATRRYTRNEPVSADGFIETYRRLLADALRNKPSTRFIIIEPFVLPTNELRVQTREDLDPKIHAIRQMAQEHEVVYIAMDGIFAEARMTASDEYWAPDGVHPSPAGHALMARAWLRAVGVGG
jgi:acyl-CoA thioesterase I